MTAAKRPRGDPADNGHMPPVDDAAEASLLGAALLDEHAARIVATQLSVDAFNKPAHGHIADTIRALYAEGVVRPDHVVVADRLRRAGLLDVSGGREYLNQLSNVDLPAVSNASRYADIVGANGFARGVIRAGAEIASLGYEMTDPVELAVRARSLLEAVDMPRRPNADALSFVDWSTFWDRERKHADWLFRDVLARGRGHSVYAAAKTGKSLFLLFAVVSIVAADPEVVAVYLDYEMTDDDLHERLTDMGYGPDVDLSRFYYALLPSLPPLDTELGAAYLLATLDALRAQHPTSSFVVIIDTTSRATAGKENDADTIRAFYRCTGLRLKQRGITWARLDNAGKVADAGQRGSSAKGDDVDVVWKLARTDAGFELTRDYARMVWVPETVTFAEGSNPLRFVPTAVAWPKGTASCAAVLDELDVPTNATVDEAVAALRDADQKTRRAVVAKALKYRRSEAGTVTGTAP